MASSLIFGVSTDVKETETENIVEDIARSSLVNRTEDFTNQSMKQDVIKEYVTNLVTRSISEQDIEQNLRNNLKVAQATVQTNKMVFEDITFDEAENITFSQVNITANDIAAEYEQLRQDCIDAVNQAVDETDIVKNVEDAMDTGNYNDYLNNLITESEKKTKQTDKITTESESYHFKRREHGLIGVETNVQKIKDKARTTNVSDDFVENVAIASVISDTDLYSRISQAYNKTVETVSKLKMEVDEVNTTDIQNSINQSNELEMKGAYFGKTKGIKFEQANEAKASIVATALIASICEMDSTNSTRAIASDMLELTQDITAKNSTSGSTNSKADRTSTSEQTNETETKLKRSQMAAIIGSILSVILIAIIGFVAIKYFQSKSPSVPTYAPSPQASSQPTVVVVPSQQPTQTPAVPNVPEENMI